MRVLDGLIADLERLRAGAIGAAEFRTRQPIGVASRVEEILGNLEHYLTDDDVRLRDPNYRTFQDGELAKLIRHLRAGDLAKAAQVSFLHVSEE